MTTTPEALYYQLVQLAETMPDLANCDMSHEVYEWLGRGSALIAQGGNRADVATFNAAANNMGTILQEMNAQTVAAIVYRTIAAVEISAPSNSRGAFIPTGGAFDAFVQVGKVMVKAAEQLVVIDAFADEKALTDYASQVTKGVEVRVLADAKDHKATLRGAAERWVQQYGNDWPLAVRFAPHRALHDRLLFIDKKEVWNLSQSLNAFANRSPASIVRLPEDVASMKLEAYGKIWDAAEVFI